VAPVAQPVIHQNDGPAGDIRGRAIAAIEPIAPRQLPQLARHDRVDFMFRNSETAHDFIVQNADTAGCDRAHCQLLVPRNAQLAHQKNIERRAERTSQLKSDGHPAARQGQDENIRPIGVSRQLLRELAAGIGAIAKAFRLHASSGSLYDRQQQLATKLTGCFFAKTAGEAIDRNEVCFWIRSALL
jgi:hypothetical protein